jgi:hypothetical protein
MSARREARLEERDRARIAAGRDPTDALHGGRKEAR